MASFWASMAMSVEMPPFTMTLLQSDLVAWYEYSSSETDGNDSSLLLDFR